MESNASDWSPLTVKPKGISFPCSPEFAAVLRAEKALQPLHDKAHDIVMRDLQSRISVLGVPPITDEERAFLSAYYPAPTDDDEE